MLLKLVTHFVMLVCTSSFCSGDDSFNLKTNNLPDDLEFMPTLGNGELGFTVFSNSVYANGVYNGANGLSHRAGIPNLSNIQIKICAAQSYAEQCQFSMDVRRGVFQVKYLDPERKFEIVQSIYAHRFYTRAIVNQINVHRLTNESSESITIDLHRPIKNLGKHGHNHRNPYNNYRNRNDNDIIFTKTKTILLENQKIRVNCGFTRQVEEAHFQQHPSRVCVLWNHVPEEITIRSEKNVSWSFLMVVDGNFSKAKAEMIDVLDTPPATLLRKHTDEWEAFWDFNIDIDGNEELNSIVHASIFYIFSSLPSLHTNQANNVFYGLSPTGLGRGGNDVDDYEGHNFWDSEIFLQPFIGLVNPKWVEILLKYRYLKLDAAKRYATITGYQGARFPWESAFTGTDVTQPAYSSVAKYQIHISADISFAVRNYFSLTHDLSLENCQLASEIAKFYLSRLTHNNVTGYYDINGVMGPDEDHEKVDNNVYTNVAAAYAIFFGSFSNCLCYAKENDDWPATARSIRLLYDPLLDYHPQYEGYQLGTSIKQADVILLNYPLQYKMENSTKFNDLRIYQNVTRQSGPAMTNAIASIGYLDLQLLQNAADTFKEGYRPYVRPPFHVWAELPPNENGARNFLTGSGGFLQSIMNGYLGLRLNITHLTINRSFLLPNTTGLTSKFSYMHSYFMIRVERGSRVLTCLKLNGVKPLKIQIGSKTEMITEQNNYDIKNETVAISPAEDHFGRCKIPVDEIGNQK